MAVPPIHNHLRSTFSKNPLRKWEMWSIFIHQDLFFKCSINLEVPSVNNFRYIKFVQSLKFKLRLLNALWQKVSKIFSRFSVLKRKKGKIFAGSCCVKTGNNSNRKRRFKRFLIQYLSQFWTKNVTVKQIPLITIDLHKIRFLLSTVLPKYLPLIKGKDFSFFLTTIHAPVYPFQMHL